MIDVTQVRAETLGVDDVVHFNNAGAGLMPDCVLEAQKDYLDLEANQLLADLRCDSSFSRIRLMWRRR